MFKPSKLRAYLIRARDAGMSPDDILKGSGVQWSDIESLQSFDLDTIAGLFDFLARRTPPGFAVACGRVSKVRDFGIVGFSMMSMPTLRDAFEHWNRYCLVAGHPLVTTISEEGDEWSMHFVPRRIMSAMALRFCIEASMAALEPIIEELTGEPAETTGIDFAFARPPMTDQYDVFLTGRIRFGRQPSTYYGKRSDLDRTIPSQDGEVSDMFHRQCAKFLAEVTNTRPIGERLEDIMRASVGNMPSLDELAIALGLSRRSLQRELKDQGISYQQLVQQFRMRHAMVLLGEKHANIKTIAFMLGFQDVGSFRRAFHSWTGQPVGEWQASQAEAPPARRRSRAASESPLHIA